MLDIDPFRAAGNPYPHVQMDGVAFCKVGLHHPFAVTPPIVSEWRLYVVRADGMEMCADDASMASGPLLRGTVIGAAGDAHHSFVSAGSDLCHERAGDGWSEVPLSARDDGDESVLIVGRIPRSAMPNLSLLGMVRINPDEHRDTTVRIGMLIDWIIDEARRDELASGAVIQRLSEIITFELARVGRSHDVLFSERPSGAVYDFRIWRSIAAVSREPEHPWTLHDMAEIAGMSRSAFAARYHEVVGMTPMRSLRRLRLHRAAVALAHSPTQTLGPLALATGYGSDAAFCRAFAKEFGHPPKHFAGRSR